MCKVQGKCFVYLCTLIACLSSILVGYDIGILSGAIVYMERDLALTKWDEEFIVALEPFFSIIGALLGGQTASSLGRKKTIVISALLFFMGNIIMIMTKEFGFIVFGRILLGIATGLSLLIIPLYTAELAPSSIRGKLVTLSEISNTSGMLSGYFIAWIFYFIHDDSAWRIMILFGCVPAIMLFIGMLIMPESPRWLIENNKENKAREILSRLSSGSDTSDEVEKKITEIQKAIEMEKEEIQSGWNEILFPCVFHPPLSLRKALIVGSGIAMFQQLTGIEAIIYYTPLIFRELGLNDQQILLCTIFVGVCKLLFLFVAMFLLDKVGRKPLLLLSGILMTLSLVLLSISSIIGGPAGLTIFLQCFYVSAFSIGWGPICWVMISEVYPLKIRSRGMALSTSINRITAAFVALFFLSISDLITPIGTWFMFTVVSVSSIIFVYTYVPETKGKTLEEITAMLVHGVKHKRVADIEHNTPKEQEQVETVTVSNTQSHGSISEISPVELSDFSDISSIP